MEVVRGVVLSSRVARPGDGSPQHAAVAAPHAGGGGAAWGAPPAGGTTAPAKGFLKLAASAAVFFPGPSSRIWPEAAGGLVPPRKLMSSGSCSAAAGMGCGCGGPQLPLLSDTLLGVDDSVFREPAHRHREL